MSEEGNHADETEIEDPGMPCPNCGETLEDDEYQTIEDGSYWEFNCPHCETVTVEETRLGGIRRYKETGEKDGLSPLMRQQIESPPGTTPTGEYDPILDPNAPNPKLKGDVLPGEECGHPDCDRTDDLERTEGRDPRCPEHYENNTEGSGHEPLEEGNNSE